MKQSVTSKSQSVDQLKNKKKKLPIPPEEIEKRTNDFFFKVRRTTENRNFRTVIIATKDRGSVRVQGEGL